MVSIFRPFCVFSSKCALIICSALWIGSSCFTRSYTDSSYQQIEHACIMHLNWISQWVWWRLKTRLYLIVSPLNNTESVHRFEGMSRDPFLDSYVLAGGCVHGGFQHHFPLYSYVFAKEPFTWELYIIAAKVNFKETERNVLFCCSISTKHEILSINRS